MLDKTSKEWKKIPIWARSVLCLISTRRAAIRQELLVSLLAAFLLIFTPSVIAGAIALVVAFTCAGAIKWVDNAELWD
ncbi:MAG: hypothetical protein R3F02_10760 [Thiolinea sp.]